MATPGLASHELREETIEAIKAELVETDGEPLETPWHTAAINLLIEVVLWMWQGRTDFFVGGNMFIYYSLSQARGRKYRGPDFFLAKGVDGTRERLYWWVFEEDSKFPDLIIELLSPTTAEEDRTTKKDLYERVFRTPKYFCYDPETHQLEGWRLIDSRYQAIPANERGWLWSDQLGAWLGKWEGAYQRRNATWPTFYDAQCQLLVTETEAVRLQAEAERQKAEAERQKAEAERQRAQAAEAEVARMKALLAEQRSSTAVPGEANKG